MLVPLSRTRLATSWRRRSSTCGFPACRRFDVLLVSRQYARSVVFATRLQRSHPKRRNAVSVGLNDPARRAEASTAEEVVMRFLRKQRDEQTPEEQIEADPVLCEHITLIPKW